VTVDASTALFFSSLTTDLNLLGAIGLYTAAAVIWYLMPGGTPPVINYGQINFDASNAILLGSTNLRAIPRKYTRAQLRVDLSNVTLAVNGKIQMAILTGETISFTERAVLDYIVSLTPPTNIPQVFVANSVAFPVPVSIQGGTVLIGDQPIDVAITGQPINVNVTGGDVTITQPVWVTDIDPTAEQPLAQIQGRDEHEYRWDPTRKDNNHDQHSATGNIDFLVSVDDVPKYLTDAAQRKLTKLGFHGVNMILDQHSVYPNEAEGWERYVVPDMDVEENVYDSGRKGRTAAAPNGMGRYERSEPRTPGKTSNENNGGDRTARQSEPSNAEPEKEIYQPERRGNFHHMLSRLLGKLRTYQDLADWVEATQPKRDLVKMLVERYSFDGREEDKVFVYARAYQHPKAAELYSYTRVLGIRDKLHASPVYQAWHQKTFGTRPGNWHDVETNEKVRVEKVSSLDECVNTEKVLESEALAHNKEMYAGQGNDEGFISYFASLSRKAFNKLMHALVGNMQESTGIMSELSTHPASAIIETGVQTKNPVSTQKRQIAAQTMTAITGLASMYPLWDDFAEGSTDAGEYDPVKDVQCISLLQSRVGISIGSATNEAVLRGAIQYTDNTTTNVGSVTPPENRMFPRTVRNGMTYALQNSAVPLTFYSVRSMPRLNTRKYSWSPMAVKLDKRASDNINKIPVRASNGFFGYDVWNASHAVPEEGESMQAWFEKLWKLRICLDPQFGDFTEKSLAGQAGWFDSFTRMSPLYNIFAGGGVGAPPITVGLNDSPVFGEDCGGNNPIFAFGPANKGNIVFHVSEQTIPSESRSNRIVIPPGLLTLGEQGSVGTLVALYLMGFCVWPWGMYTQQYGTVDPTGGIDGNNTPGQQTFISNACCAVQQGYDNLDVVLPPTANQEPVPRAQGAANLLPLWAPTTGPQGTVGFAPNTPLNVMYLGGAYGAHSYSLVDFLYSWLHPASTNADPRTIMLLMRWVARKWKCQVDLESGRIRAILSENRWTPLFEVNQSFNGTNGAPFVFPVSTAPGNAAADYFGRVGFVLTGDMPFAGYPDNFHGVEPQLSLAFASTMAYGLLEVVADDDQEMQNEMDISGRWGMYSSSWARQFAVGQCALNRSLALPVGMWNDAVSNTQFSEVNALVMGMFIAGLSESWAGAKYGNHIARIQEKVTGNKIPRDRDGNTVWSYHCIPPFGFMLPIGVAGALSDTCCNYLRTCGSIERCRNHTLKPHPGCRGIRNWRAYMKKVVRCSLYRHRAAAIRYQ